MIETFEWDAKPGHVELPDGKRVTVQAGDRLLGFEDDEGEVTFLIHERPRPN